MKYNGIIAKKLSYLKDQLAELRSWELGTVEDFTYDFMKRRAVERMLQVCVEAMIDICEHLLAVQDIAPGETSVENLHKVAELGFIEEPTRFESIVRFRNLVVHMYESVDPAMLHDIVQNRLGDIDTFVTQIESQVMDDDTPDA